MSYYDPHPTLVLDRPLALVGFMGSGVASVGRFLAARTGLSLVLLDRSIENAAGMGRGQLMLEQGSESLRALEARLLERALHERPCGVVVLGDGALLRPENQERVREHAYLVYLERPLHVCFDAVVRERERSAATIPEFMLAPPASIADLEPYFAEREPGYRSAHSVLAARDLHPHRIVDALLGELRGGVDASHPREG